MAKQSPAAGARVAAVSLRIARRCCARCMHALHTGVSPDPHGPMQMQGAHDQVLFKIGLVADVQYADVSPGESCSLVSALAGPAGGWFPFLHHGTSQTVQELSHRLPCSHTVL